MKDYSKYFGKDWAQFLDPFLRSKAYYDIGVELKRQTDMGIEISPGYQNIFRAFKECPWHTLHTIIIGQDSYYTKTPDGDLVADGIAFSAKCSTTPPPSLNLIHEAISDSIFDGDYAPPCSWNPELSEVTYDLTTWARQGMLLINCGMTTIVGRSNEHINLWSPFVQHVVKHVTDRRDNLGIVLIGNHAKALRPLITNDTHFVGMVEHPAAALYSKRRWEHQNVFSALDKFHKVHNNIKIEW